jgi:hypothetical protein
MGIELDPQSISLVRRWRCRLLRIQLDLSGAKLFAERLEANCPVVPQELFKIPEISGHAATPS